MIDRPCIPHEANRGAVSQPGDRESGCRCCRQDAVAWSTRGPLAAVDQATQRAFFPGASWSAVDPAAPEADRSVQHFRFMGLDAVGPTAALGYLLRHLVV
jgi:hypothetical protein